MFFFHFFPSSGSAGPDQTTEWRSPEQNFPPRGRFEPFVCFLRVLEQSFTAACQADVN